MTRRSPIGDEIDSDPNFEEKWSCIQKVARGIMVVLVLAGLAGVFGRGPLSKTTAEAQGVRLRVQYERFPRFRTPATLEIDIPRQTSTQTQCSALSGSSDAPVQAQAQVQLTGDMMKKLSIEQVMPMPALTQPLPNGAIFTFNLPCQSNSAKVVFVQQAGAVGLASGEVALKGSPPIQFNQFIYP